MDEPLLFSAIIPWPIKQWQLRYSLCNDNMFYSLGPIFAQVMIPFSTDPGIRLHLSSTAVSLIIDPRPYTLNPLLFNGSLPYSRPYTLYPKPQTPNPKS
jgi:hypothetical protein